MLGIKANRLHWSDCCKRRRMAGSVGSPGCLVVGVVRLVVVRSAGVSLQPRFGGRRSRGRKTTRSVLEVYRPAHTTGDCHSQEVNEKSSKNYYIMHFDIFGTLLPWILTL